MQKLDGQAGPIDVRLNYVVSLYSDREEVLFELQIGFKQPFSRQKKSTLLLRALSFSSWSAIITIEVLLHI